MNKLHRFYFNGHLLTMTGDRLHHKAAMLELKHLNEEYHDSITFTCPRWCKTVNGK